MEKILVIGIGSRVMKDDAIGIYLAEDLRQLDRYSDITFIIGETDVDYCIAEALAFDNIIIIDAFLSGKHPGEIIIIPLKGLNEKPDANFYSMHGMHLLSMLIGMKHSAKGIFIGIEPYEIEYGFSLSGRLQSCYPRIIAEVQKIIQEYVEQYGGVKNA
jgi:hydrogenase maturation protease